MSFDLKILFVCYNGNSLPAHIYPVRSRDKYSIFFFFFFFLFFSIKRFFKFKLPVKYNIEKSLKDYDYNLF